MTVFATLYEAILIVEYQKSLMNEKAVKVRSASFARYIFLNGILGFALPTTFLIHTVIYFLDHGLDDRILSRFLTGRYLLFFVLNILVMGVFLQ